MPIAIARAVSAIGERIAGLTGRPPLIPRGALIFLESHPVPDAARVRSELRLEIDAVGVRPRGDRRAIPVAGLEDRGLSSAERAGEPGARRRHVRGVDVVRRRRTRGTRRRGRPPRAARGPRRAKPTSMTGSRRPWAMNARMPARSARSGCQPSTVGDEAGEGEDARRAPGGRRRGRARSSSPSPSRSRRTRSARGPGRCAPTARRGSRRARRRRRGTCPGPG